MPALPPQILGLDQIRRSIDIDALIEDVASAFVSYSRGQATVPPVGHLAFGPTAPGDVHIKYGYIESDRCYVVKVASGFPDHGIAGMPVSNGLMLLFERTSGALAAILLDEGYLTDLRTGIAGAIAARHLAPTHVRCIGIVGTGVQARFQLRLLAQVTSCRDVIVFGRSDERLEQFAADMQQEGFTVRTTRDISRLIAESNLIVTTTAATQSLIAASDVRPGTHITAMGADAPGKQELQPELVAAADTIVVDSRSQCVEHGEISHAVRSGLLSIQRIVELGDVVSGTHPGRTDDDQITIADLTGVAVQDIAIANHVLRRNAQ